MRISNQNKYFPRDTNNIIPRQIEDRQFQDFNFFYLFNIPNIHLRNNKLKIRINEEIERFKWNEEFLNSISRRLSNSFNSLKGQGYKSFDVVLQLSFRMVIGLGASHPQETSMTLHHIYGIPYIPGSAVKGVTRHWIIASQFDNDEKKAEEDKDFKDIFGTQAQAGKIIFFDAYPVDRINLKIDVMTPHYPDYYSKGVEPADWQSPNPIKFLTVEKTKFSFWLAVREKALVEAGREKALEELVKKAKEWLTDALKKYGIGAKTSIGYGYFE